MVHKHSVYFAKNVQEIHTRIRNINDIIPLAGVTRLLQGHRDDRLTLPENILFLKGIPELEAIIKRERFIDFGAAAVLNDILNLGYKNIPQVLYAAISAAANPNIRSLATIGGNIADAPIKSSCLIPLIALDAKIEVRTPKELIWMNLSKYSEERMVVLKPEPHVILRIRVPLDEWNFSYYRRLGPIGRIAEDTASFVFLARMQKNILMDIKMLFGSTKLLKNREFENRLAGTVLPLDRKKIADIMHTAYSFFTENGFSSPFQRHCFFNLIEDSLYRLSQGSYCSSDMQSQQF
ncbi:MAG: FAD binding domain-containing protein [Treponema sp.]